MGPRSMPVPITAEQRLCSEVQTAMLHELFWSHLRARLSSWVTDTILVIFASTNVLWSSLNALMLYFMKMSEYLLLLRNCLVALELALHSLVDSNQQDLSWSPLPSEPLLTPVYCLTSAPLRGSVPNFHIICSGILFFFPWPWAVSLYLCAGQHSASIRVNPRAPLSWCSALRSCIHHTPGVEQTSSLCLKSVVSLVFNCLAGKLDLSLLNAQDGFNLTLQGDPLSACSTDFLACLSAHRAWHITGFI